MTRTTRVAAAGGALALQLAVLYAPRAPSVATGGLPVDKLVHVVVFALPTAALIRAGAPARWVVGLMALHAPLSEVVQHAMLPNRSGDGADMAADLLGVGIGALAVLGRREAGSAPGPARAPFGSG